MEEPVFGRIPPTQYSSVSSVPFRTRGWILETFYLQLLKIIESETSPYDPWLGRRRPSVGLWVGRSVIFS